MNNTNLELGNSKYNRKDETTPRYCNASPLQNTAGTENRFACPMSLAAPIRSSPAASLLRHSPKLPRHPSSVQTVPESTPQQRFFV